MPRVSNPPQATPLDFPGMAVAPAVAPVGSARMYFDSGTGKLRASESGGAYVDVIGGGAVAFPLLATPTGTPAAPAYSYLGDTATGKYRDAAGEIGMALAGTEVFRLADSMLLATLGFGTLSVSPAALAAGNNNNYAIAAGYVFRITPGAGSVITGIVAPNPARTRFLMLINVGAAPFSISNQDVNSVATNRIITTTGAAVVVNIAARVLLTYDPVTTRWRCTLPT